MDMVRNLAWRGPTVEGAWPRVIKTCSPYLPANIKLRLEWWHDSDIKDETGRPIRIEVWGV